MILFITKNSDTFNNPVLFSFFSFLEQKNEKSILICENNFFKSNFHKSKILYFNQIKRPKIRRNIFLFAINIFTHLFFLLRIYFLKSKIKTIIGIDPEGLILANEIKKLYLKNVPLDYLSFEIRYENEYENKAEEIAACEGIRNLIIQDQLRDSIIRRENNIKKTVNSVFIPVSTADFCYESTSSKNFNFRERYNISLDEILLVSFGTLDNWSGAFLLKEIAKENLIPEKTRIIIHSRYPLNTNNSIHREVLEISKNNNKLIICEDYIDSYSDTVSFLKQFDLGIALYIPERNKAYIGDNIYNIGLSSGKFSTYMRSQLPTIASDLPTYNELNKQYNFGYTINSLSEFSEVLKNIGNLDLKKKNCSYLFNDKLNSTQSIMKYINVFG